MNGICKLDNKSVTWPCSARTCPLFGDCIVEYQTMAKNQNTCPHCGGKLRSESIGWKCENCQGFVDMQFNFHEHIEKPFMPPMTNADRIRAMTDQELAGVIMCPMEFNSNKDLCEKNHGYTCVECSLRWLQEPAKED